MDIIQKSAETINRQRISPRIWDYSYLLLKNNLRIFAKFKKLLTKENKIKLLDVGCGFKPWAQMLVNSNIEYIGVDIDKEKASPDYIASTDNLPFPDDSFNALIYSEVLEHVGDLDGTLKEMKRIAKSGALIFISSPFIFPLHGVPYDYQRLTRYFYQDVFKDDELVSLKESNSSFSSIFVSFSLFIESTLFSRFSGFKHLVYILNNIIGLAADLLIDLGLKVVGNKFRAQFYAMPLGYALVVRIKK